MANGAYNEASLATILGSNTKLKHRDLKGGSSLAVRLPDGSEICLDDEGSISYIQYGCGKKLRFSSSGVVTVSTSQGGYLMKFTDMWFALD